MWSCGLIPTHMVMCFIHQAQAYGNLAVGRPTQQSSTRPSHSSGYHAHWAVDGSRANQYTSSGIPCTHTEDDENNPWWSVDMERRYTLAWVNITNRADCCADRLKNLRIGMTDTDPGVTAPSLAGLRVCASRDSAVPAGVTQPFSCTATGRYLVILLEGINTLTLCEVEVSGARDQMYFLKKANSRLVGHVIELMNVQNEISCAGECASHILCGSFNLQTDTSGNLLKCELNAFTSAQQTTEDMTADAQWSFHPSTLI